ncbi:MAG: bacteriohemerythrin [Polyangiaceae bacterium]
MALIDWNKDRFTVQIKQFDDEHQELIRLINDLHAAMKGGKSRDLMGYTLNKLVEYTKTHFSNEEAVLARHGYPELAPHRKQHVDFTRQVAEFQRQFGSGETAVTVDVMEFLRTWLVDHIQKSDRSYATFLASKNVH